MRTTRPIEMFSLRVTFELARARRWLVDGALALGRPPDRPTLAPGPRTRPTWPRSRSPTAAGRWRPRRRRARWPPRPRMPHDRPAWPGWPGPCSRNQVMAWSMSPSFSSRARLASSMPTPVRWRRVLDVFGREGRHGQASSVAGTGRSAASGAVAVRRASLGWLGGASGSAVRLLPQLGGRRCAGAGPRPVPARCGAGLPGRGSRRAGRCRARPAACGARRAGPALGGRGAGADAAVGRGGGPAGVGAGGGDGRMRRPAARRGGGPAAWEQAAARR